MHIVLEWMYGKSLELMLLRKNDSPTHSNFQFWTFIHDFYFVWILLAIIKGSTETIIFISVFLSLIRIRVDRKFSQDMQNAFNLEIKAENKVGSWCCFCVRLLLIILLHCKCMWLKKWRWNNAPLTTGQIMWHWMEIN